MVRLMVRNLSGDWTRGHDMESSDQVHEALGDASDVLVS